jgi:4-aminobutyrate aminotransferase / (S)-3-amino-2-methylpropionate transaminase / 5-aminovalerate transaminase
MPLSEFPVATEETSGDEPPEIKVAPPGPMSKSAAARLEKVECPAFAARREARQGDDGPPIVLMTGRGSNLYDVDGNRYVDLAAGFGSLLLGHAATSVARAMEAQGDRLIQALGDVYVGDAKIGLLERLVALHPEAGARALVTQSGSDAVTAALKTAVLATGKKGVLAFEGAYHGLGYAPLAACGLRESYRAPFAGQLGKHVTFAPYPHAAADAERALAAAERALATGDIGAVLVEPVLGRGGCVVPPHGFLSALGEAAKRANALVIADEIWTGLGRTGAMLRSVEVGLVPDLICLGKGLGGGLPISACIGGEPVMRAWARDQEVVHTSTHAGWPLACAAAVATLDSLRFKHLPARAAEVGARTLDALRIALLGAPGLVDVRGVGLMIGIELASAELGQTTARRLLGKGYVVLTGGAKGETLTLTPALTIGEQRLTEFGQALRETLS